MILTLLSYRHRNNKCNQLKTKVKGKGKEKENLKQENSHKLLNRICHCSCRTKMKLKGSLQRC